MYRFETRKLPCAKAHRIFARNACVVAVVLAATTPPAFSSPGTPVFTDVTQISGIDYVQHQIPNRRETQAYISGGAAAGDYDGDGWIDLYVTRLDDSNILYRNLGNGTFEDVTGNAFDDDPAITGPADHMSDVESNGCAWGDIDNDGDLDLYVTSLNGNRYHLFINAGDGTFNEQGLTRGAAVEGDDLHFGFSAAFGDYDLDGFIDLHVTEWRRDSQNTDAAPQNTRLLRNRGSEQPGHFVDVTVAAGVAMDEVLPRLPDGLDSQSFASRFCDMDGDGFVELLVASDHGTSRLFWNNGDGTFIDGTDAARVGTDTFGMGSAVGDYDGDGDFDWFVTSIYGPELSSVRDGNRLYRNDGDRKFTDVTDEAGVRDGKWGWGATFFDADNDGDLDLAMTNGAEFWFAPRVTEGFEDDPSVFWLNNGDGTFTDTSAESGITDTLSGKGLLTFDYDRDGDLDLFIVNNGTGPVLYRNDTQNTHDWLKVQTIGTVTNRDGFGTRVSVTVGESTPMLREINGGNNYLGQDEATGHFGLGETNAPVTVTIRWPSGIVQRFENVARNATLTATEPSIAPAVDDMAPTISRSPGNGRIVLRWRTQAGASYVVESSRDLVEWTDLDQIEAAAPVTSYFPQLPQDTDTGHFRIRHILPGGPPMDGN